MSDGDEARNESWRVTLHQIAVNRRCVPDEIEVRITTDSEGGPRYALYIKGEKISDTNAVDVMWLRR